MLRFYIADNHDHEFEDVNALGEGVNEGTRTTHGNEYK